MRRKIAEVVEKDYTDVIRRKMDNVYSLAGGGDRAEREKKEKDQREAFGVSSLCFWDMMPLLMELPTDILERPRCLCRLHGAPH